MGGFRAILTSSEFDFTVFSVSFFGSRRVYLACSLHGVKIYVLGYHRFIIPRVNILGFYGSCADVYDTLLEGRSVYKETNVFGIVNRRWKMMISACFASQTKCYITCEFYRWTYQIHICEAYMTHTYY